MGLMSTNGKLVVWGPVVWDSTGTIDFRRKCQESKPPIYHELIYQINPNGIFTYIYQQNYPNVGKTNHHLVSISGPFRQVSFTVCEPVKLAPGLSRGCNRRVRCPRRP